ncbi:GNAT family N-acetyltransferase [Taibaiella chishuiensis]|uniref:Acetyltransferase (GNAT) family protein n=1 Tax=Taibaiella chishuiensis TaxID=1434707 RepID=A0A2P8D5Y8_9BACT|nr:GNAT family N-acetyltransferase [Taibaiella chishuiensis]PSK92609.1 acetyltransferase (GNAT) family protein [Taibaiella chishuiensis]
MSLLIERKIDNLLISADKAKIDARVVHHFLDQESYWARGIPFDTVVRAIEHSICLGAYLPDGTLAGFGRMITDQATFAYLADVFVQPAYRGQGISKALMQVFCDMADEFGLRRFLLTTQDAHGLYHQYGFDPFPYPERLMSRPGVVYPV